MISLLELFIEAGLGTDHIDNDGRTVLSYAKEFESNQPYYYKPIVQFLESCGNVNRIVEDEKEDEQEDRNEDGKEDEEGGGKQSEEYSGKEGSDEVGREGED